MSQRFIFSYFIAVILYCLFDVVSTWFLGPIWPSTISKIPGWEPWQKEMLFSLWGWVVLHVVISIITLWLVKLKNKLGFFIMFLFCFYGLYGGVTVSLSILFEGLSWGFLPNKLYALFNVIVFIMSSIAVVTILKNNYLSRKK